MWSVVGAGYKKGAEMGGKQRLSVFIIAIHGGILKSLLHGYEVCFPSFILARP